jgi:hypothetical protein
MYKTWYDTLTINITIGVPQLKIINLKYTDNPLDMAPSHLV